MAVLAVATASFALVACVRAGSPRASAASTGTARSSDTEVTLRGAWGHSVVKTPAPAFDPRPFVGTTVTHGAAGTRMIALTFDDGPSAESTAVLQVLERERVPATFFFVGDRISGHPDIPARAIADGDDVGNHTLHHVEMVGLSRPAMLEQILSTNQIIREATRREPIFFRPRSGHADAAAKALVARLGMVMVLWDERDGDTDAKTTVAGITSQALAHAHSGGIILMHETNPNTVAALPGIIAGLRAKGLLPVTLTTMLKAEGKPGDGSVARAGNAGSHRK